MSESLSGAGRLICFRHEDEEGEVAEEEEDEGGEDEGVADGFVECAPVERLHTGSCRGTASLIPTSPFGGPSLGELGKEVLDDDEGAFVFHCGGMDDRQEDGCGTEDWTKSGSSSSTSNKSSLVKVMKPCRRGADDPRASTRPERPRSRLCAGSSTSTRCAAVQKNGGDHRNAVSSRKRWTRWEVDERNTPTAPAISATHHGPFFSSTLTVSLSRFTTGEPPHPGAFASRDLTTDSRDLNEPRLEGDMTGISSIAAESTGVGGLRQMRVQVGDRARSARPLFRLQHLASFAACQRLLVSLP